MKPLKEAVIVVPIHKNALNEFEEVSLKQLERVLSGHPIVLAVPKSSRLPVQKFRKIAFPNRFFGCRWCYSQLLCSNRFYRTFQNYKYILIYQPDCLVFKDELLDWCRKGYDYVGPPWFKDLWKEEMDWHDASAVGGGGFSLRKTESCLRVIRRRQRKLFFQYPFFFLRTCARLARLGAGLAKRFALGTLWGDWSDVYRSHHHYSYLHDIDGLSRFEDQFWSLEAPKLDPGFKIPNPEEAMRFALERGAEEAVEKMGSLPFGCHAWYRWKEEKEFWMSKLQ